MLEELLLDIESLLRKSISEEQEAVSSYLDRVIRLGAYHKILGRRDDTNDSDMSLVQSIKDSIEDILKEEKVHIGQLSELLKRIQPDTSNEQKGIQEAIETLERK